jgi:hypothetical protein
MYLTDELKFAVESISMIKLISAPINILLAFLSSYLSSTEPFKYQFYISLTTVLMSTYNVLVMLGTFDKENP